MNAWDKTPQGKENARIRSKNYRERMKARGMIKVSEWLHKDDAKELQQFIDQLKNNEKYHPDKNI